MTYGRSSSGLASVPPVASGPRDVVVQSQSGGVADAGGRPLAFESASMAVDHPLFSSPAEQGRCACVSRVSSSRGKSASDAGIAPIDDRVRWSDSPDGEPPDHRDPRETGGPLRHSPITDEQLTEDFLMSSPQGLDQPKVLTIPSVLSISTGPQGARTNEGGNS